MSPLVLQHEKQDIRIPPWVCDLPSFRRWAKSDDFPKRGWYGHLGGELWVDLSMERLAHNQIKTKIGAVLTLLAEQTDAGTFLGDRMLLTNVEAALSTEPDGMFFSYQAVKTGRVVLEKGEDSLEIEGSPEMVLEVISPSSVHKDTVILRDLYWQAGIGEYWMADSRGETASLEIFRRGAKGYVAGRKQGGWMKSPLFGKSFRLTRTKDPLGNPAFTLAAR